MEINKTLIPWKRGELHSFFDSFEQDMDNMFSSAFSDVPFNLTTSVKSSYPKIDFIDEEEKYTINATVPGLQKDNIKLEINKDPDNGYNILTISGRREDKLQETKKNYLYKEIKSSSFSRSVNIGNNSDVDKITAVINNVILSIVIPKLQPVKKEDINKPKTIEIK